jgi:hypothetical protein
MMTRLTTLCASVLLPITSAWQKHTAQGQRQFAGTEQAAVSAGKNAGGSAIRTGKQAEHT